MRLTTAAHDWLTTFFQSIRFRITLWFVLILAVVLAAFSTYIYLAQARDLTADAANNMQQKLGRLELYLRSPDWEYSTSSPTAAAGNAAPLQPDDVMVLADAQGTVLQTWGPVISKPGDLVAVLVSDARDGASADAYQQHISLLDQNNQAAGKDYLFSVTPILREGNLLGYLVIGSPSSLAERLRRLAISLLLGGLGMLLVASLGGFWLADRAMRPVRAIAQTARSISESDLHHRLNLRGKDELAQLANTFDDMLARLQAAFDRQRRFIADASHELRTPLTIMRLELGRVLGSSRPPDKYQHALQVVSAESERMTRLVQDLMTLARMDAGEATMQWENLDLGEVAVEAAERLSAVAARRQIILDVGQMPKLQVRGDRQYLVLMVSNLIENGIKYSGPGSTVKIQAQVDREVDRKVGRLLVSDNGSGIPAEHLPTLFDRFYRVDAARSAENDDEDLAASGSGLGLSIVAGIVQLHGGQVHVSSQPGQGTTFEIKLPLASAA